MALLTFAEVSEACLQGYHLPSTTALPKHPAERPSTTVAVNLQMLEPIKIQLDGVALAGAGEQRRESVTTDLRDKKWFVDYAAAFEASPKGTRSFEATTDYAVALVHTGRHLEAISVLRDLEASRPGVYTTASNLGTAYELAGNLEEAQTWIALGIERNPDSHHGSEWLHLAILRARLALRADSDWLKQHTVLEGEPPRKDEEIVRAIEYQLNERLQFVSAPDPIVCDLFYQAAIRSQLGEANSRRAYYLKESLRFGPWRKREIAAL